MRLMVRCRKAYEPPSRSCTDRLIFNWSILKKARLNICKYIRRDTSTTVKYRQSDSTQQNDGHAVHQPADRHKTNNNHAVSTLRHSIRPTEEYTLVTPSRQTGRGFRSCKLSPKAEPLLN